jgi:hypothetical protein
VWNVHAGRFDGGWTTEMAIPFKSLRYVSGQDQVWGIQLRRSIRRKNEWAHLTRCRRRTADRTACFAFRRRHARRSRPAVAGRNIQLKPYLSADNTAIAWRPAVNNDVGTGWGGDSSTASPRT